MVAVAGGLLAGLATAYAVGHRLDEQGTERRARPRRSSPRPRRAAPRLRSWMTVAGRLGVHRPDEGGARHEGGQLADGVDRPPGTAGVDAAHPRKGSVPGYLGRCSGRGGHGRCRDRRAQVAGARLEWRRCSSGSKSGCASTPAGAGRPVETLRGTLAPWVRPGPGEASGNNEGRRRCREGRRRTAGTVRRCVLWDAG
jgi:hypothetical protein